MSFKLPLLPSDNEYCLKNALNLQNALFEHSQINESKLTRCSETLGKRGKEKGVMSKEEKEL